MMDQATFEQAEAYLAGTLSVGERESFEARLAAEKDLAEEVGLLETSNKALTDLDTLDFMMQVQAAEAEYLPPPQEKQPSPQGVVRSLNRIFWVAASLVVLLTAGWWLWQQANPRTGAETFLAIYTPAEPPANYRSGTVAYPETLKQAFSAYQDREYAAAAQKFRGMQQDTLFGPTANYYLAHTLLAQDSAAAGQALLSPLAHNAATVYQTEAEWYLALAYLRMGKLGQARQTAEHIQQTPRHPYSEKVDALLKNFPQE